MKIEDYTYKKSVCERYDLRWKHNGWATFTIDENGGLFNAQSDFGNYSYAWPNHGRKSFKHFIVQDLARDPEYVLGKISKEDYFNLEKAENGWKARIIDIRKQDACTKKQARDAWEFINELDLSGSVDYIQNEIYSSSEISAISEEPWYDFEIELDYPYMAVRFANEVMPMLADILRKEIEEKEKASAPTEAEKKKSHFDCTMNVSKIEPFVDRVMAEEILRNEAER
ncbi:hypothetical protein REC12_20485 [Desulfosporosinus sp. PR]|uniref:hypothetical protein n=1 Tax=Candidatus Desulfosporosinus nitrosoreducens TaxID=3401928 RepID=UPI0027F5A37F|nr:hypothetical protein [Desulfosporosinus sp. PR]MDQ7095976.1 hypothetical protein [Desulfosporosinus sp. PR]